jgi:hypothetical protein
MRRDSTYNPHSRHRQDTPKLNLINPACSSTRPSGKRIFGTRHPTITHHRVMRINTNPNTWRPHTTVTKAPLISTFHSGGYRYRSVETFRRYPCGARSFSTPSPGPGPQPFHPVAHLPRRLRLSRRLSRVSISQVQHGHRTLPAADSLSSCVFRAASSLPSVPERCLFWLCGPMSAGVRASCSTLGAPAPPPPGPSCNAAATIHLRVDIDPPKAACPILTPYTNGRCCPFLRSSPRW